MTGSDRDTKLALWLTVRFFAESMSFVASLLSVDQIELKL